MAKRLITPAARAAYLKAITPEKNDDGVDKYACTFVFPTESEMSPQDKAKLKDLKLAVVGKAREVYGDKAAGMIKSGKLATPFHTDEEKYPGMGEFFTARTDRKPGVVSTVPDPKNNGKPMVITNEDEIYSGMWVVGSVTVFAYDRKGKKGISFALGNLQKVGDAERWDNRRAAEDEFASDPNASASLESTESEDPSADANEDSEDDLAALLNA